MTDWIRIAVLLGGGFLLLWRGADWLVGGSTQIARRLGVSTMVIGLTVIAFGTSAPEIIVSGLAAVEGKVDLSLGNVLGSNVANIGLVLGACALVLPRVLEATIPLREVLWLFLSLFALQFCAQDHEISRNEGLALLVAFLFYNFIVFRSAVQKKVPEEEPSEDPPAGTYGRRPWFWTLTGIVAILIAAKLVVMGAEDGALKIGIPKSVVGLTVVAIGTSLPELAAGLGGAVRGESDISLGNVVGSNVFNVLAVIGIVALVQPISPAALPQASEEIDKAFELALHEDIWVVLAFSLAAVVLPRLSPGRGGRAKGMLLLAGYAGYTAWLYVSRMA